MKKIFLFAAVAMLALVGCEKQVQSSLDLNQVEKAATVSGTLVAYVNAPGQATQTVPLQGIRVYVQVASSKYADDAAKGNQQFEATTDAEGKFSIPVKTGAKEIDGAKFKSDDFKYQVGDRTIYYEALDESLGKLNAGDIRQEYFVAKEDAVLNQTVGVAFIQGKVVYSAGYVKKADGTYEEKTHAYAANANVIASVTYFKNDKDRKVVKKFTTKSNADGDYSFEIPVEAEGDSVALDIEQFKADSTCFENNEWVTRERFYTMSKPVELKAEEVQANVTLIRELKADKTDAIPTDNKIIKFNVVGKIFEQAEVETYNSSGKHDGYKLDKQPTKYPFTVRLDYYDSGKTKVESSILYEGNEADKEGKFSVPVELYDGWDIKRVKVLVYADRTVKVSDGKDGYVHYYFQANSSHEFKTEGKDRESQNVAGIYKGGEKNVLNKLGSSEGTWAQDKNIFFDLEVGDTLKIPFEAESPAKVKGRMSVQTGAYSDTKTGPYTEEIYVLGDDEATNKKYYKKEDVYEIDLMEKGGKKFVDCMGGIEGLW